MPKRSFRYCAAVLGASAILLAAGPVGSVTSASSFVLRGAAVNVQGVPSWPLASGDDIATNTDSASVDLKDGSKVLLGANSHAIIDNMGGVLNLRLLAGTMTVTPAKSPSFRFYSGSELLNTKPGTGLTVSVNANANVAARSRAIPAMRVATPPPNPPPTSRR